MADKKSTIRNILCCKERIILLHFNEIYMKFLIPRKSKIIAFKPEVVEKEKSRKEDGRE